MKKLLILGGMHIQIPAIKKAVEMGFYVITADYLPNNPGHKFAHVYHNVNIKDKDAILELSKKMKIDGIVSYANEYGVSTAAYVSEELGFPTSPYESVEILSNKDKFRSFLSNNGFNCPKAKSYTKEDIQKALNEITEFALPVFIKPVDAASCKGITILRDTSKYKKAIENALSISKAKRFIIEEFVEKDGYQIGGDGFSVNGELAFRCFSNQHFDAKTNIVPYGESYPYIRSSEVHTKIHNEIQRLLKLLNMKSSAYNFEVRINKNGDVFIMEASPRSGGSYIPQVIKYATGVDMVEYAIKAAIGIDCSDLKMIEPNGFWAEYDLHVYNSGILQDIWFEEQFKKDNLVELNMFSKIGDKIEIPVDGSDILGVMILKFANQKEMIDKMDNIDKWYKVILDDVK